MTIKKDLLKNSVLFILLTAIFFATSAFQLNPAIDTGREFYIPFRMLGGEVLYKDIFNIYGALAYQINTFAYFLLGAKVTSLRLLGSINATVIVIATYLILKEIFNAEKTKLIFNFETENKILLTALPLFIGILSFGTFNYVVPYAFSMTYGLMFFLVSVLFFIKFSKTYNPQNAYIACLFAGAAFSCKYEFLAYSILLILYVALSKKIETKNVVRSIASIVIVPILSYGSLFIQGMSTEDLKTTCEILKTMANTEAIKYLYANFTGTYFNIEVFKICLIKTLLLGIICAIYAFSKNLYKTDKFLSIIVLIFSLLCIFYLGTAAFSLFAIINMILFFVFLKKIYQDKPIFIFMLSSILLSLKTFFAVNIDVYGTYTLPFILISLAVFTNKVDYSDKQKIKENIASTVNILILSVILLCVIKNTGIFLQKINGKINTNSNSVIENLYTFPHIAKSINSAKTYILKETKENDKIIILPETQFLNFLTKRVGDNLYDSLTPMYFETFGEEKIINHFAETKPEYFILNNRNTADYGKRYICDDYGKQFCNFVKNDYKNVATFGEKQYILQVFKRKDLL